MKVLYECRSTTRAEDVLHVSQPDFPLPGLLLDVYLYWHSSRSEDPANAWLRSELLATFDSGPRDL